MKEYLKNNLISVKGRICLNENTDHNLPSVSPCAALSKFISSVKVDALEQELSSVCSARSQHNGTGACTVTEG